MAMKKIARREDRWTADEFRAEIDYNPETGEFWTRPRKIGSVQYFGKNREPAVTITLQERDGIWRKRYGHQLAWLWMTGEWPSREVDHINTNPIDNRWENLRLATRSQQNMNRRPIRPGLTGASFHKPSGRWQAYIKKDRKIRCLGYFKTAEEAHEAYRKAALEMHGEFVHATLARTEPHQ